MDRAIWLTGLFEYPDDGYRARAEHCASAIGSEELRAFARAIAELSTGELQELFIQSFDLNPASALEIGWHLFGEQYERGEFLVDLRGRLRAAGIAERGELPDHLLHVLPLMARLEAADAERFATRFLVPALEKIAAALPEGNPFRSLVNAVAGTVRLPADPTPVTAGEL